VSPRFDLIVRNGTPIIRGVGTVAADVGICGSRIAAIGDDLAGPARSRMILEGYRSDIGGIVVILVV